MTLQDILKLKGALVHSIEPDASVEAAVRRLVEHNIGSLIVLDSGESGPPLGIVTERDILHVCASRTCGCDEVKVSEIMSTNLITATPEDGVEKIMGLMTQRRIRHLPVLSAGKLVGMVSIGDVVKAQHDRLAIENQFMKDYIRS